MKHDRKPACATCASTKTIGSTDDGYFCVDHRPTIHNELLVDMAKLLRVIAPKCMRATCGDYALYRITSNSGGKSGKAQSERLACETHKMTNEHESLKELTHTPALRNVLPFLG